MLSMASARASLLLYLLLLAVLATAQTTKHSSTSSSSSSSSSSNHSSYSSGNSGSGSSHASSTSSSSYTPPASTNTYHPPANTNTNTYHPPASTNSYQPSRNYPPGASSSGTTHSYTPGVTTAHTYTPGGSSANATGTTHTYTPGTPHTYTPGASSHATYTPSNQGLATTHGTVYTPSAHPANSYTPVATSTTATGASLSAGAAHAADTAPASQKLDAKGSTTTIHELNSARTSMSGINGKPLPAGTVTTRANGMVSIAASGGRKFDVRPNGSISSAANGHMSAAFTLNGKLRSVRTPFVDIYRGPHHAHVIINHRPDHITVVSTGRHTGYYERPFTNNGQHLIARTTLTPAGPVTTVYRNVTIMGVQVPYFIPGQRYPAGYYGWAYYPWDATVAYSWTWGDQLNAYLGYYAAANGYDSASAWLTDYLLGNTLADGGQSEDSSDNADQNADQAQNGDEMQSDGSDPDYTYAQKDSPITPELRQAIAAEVQQQIAYENAAAQKPNDGEKLSGLSQALVPDHIFVADQLIFVPTLEGATCSLGAGNLIRLITPPTDSDSYATLSVAASRKLDCPVGVQIQLPISALAEMENNYRAQLSQGLDLLHQEQGKNGLPAAPSQAMASPPVASYNAPADQPNVAAAIAGDDAAGRQAEAQANQLLNSPAVTTAKN
jgi:hypothetical protein